MRSRERLETGSRGKEAGNLVLRLFCANPKGEAPAVCRPATQPKTTCLKVRLAVLGSLLAPSHGHRPSAQGRHSPGSPLDFGGTLEKAL